VPEKLDILEGVTVRPTLSPNDWGYGQWLWEQQRDALMETPVMQPPGLEGELIRPGEGGGIPVLEEYEITATKPGGRSGIPDRPILSTDELIKQLEQTRRAGDPPVMSVEEVVASLDSRAAALKNQPTTAPKAETKTSAPVQAKYDELSSRLAVMEEAVVRAQRIQRAGPGVGIGMGMLADAFLPSVFEALPQVMRDLGMPVNLPVPRRAPASERKGRSETVVATKPESLTQLQPAVVTATRQQARSLSISPASWGLSVPQISNGFLDVLEEANVTATRSGSATNRGTSSRSGSSVRSRVGAAPATADLLGLSMPTGTSTATTPGRASGRVPAPSPLPFLPGLGFGTGTLTAPGTSTGGGAGEAPPPVKTKECSCDDAMPPKKKKPKKPRRICYKGTYIEKSKSLSKRRRQRVDCITGQPF